MAQGRPWQLIPIGLALPALAVLLTACTRGGPPPVVPKASVGATVTPTPSSTIEAVAPVASGQQQEASLPAAREELAGAALGGRLYAIGGYDAAGRDTDTVFVYASGAWSSGPPLPVRLDHPSAAVLSDRLYVAGGFSAAGASRTVYRLAGDRWEVVAPMRHARGGLSLVSAGDRLYALGGRDAMATIAIAEVYDPDRNAWSDLPAMPKPRHHMAGFAYQGMACGAGGKFPYTARVDCYDPAAGVWRRLPDLPQPTSGAGATVIDDLVLVVGGESTVVVPWVARFDGTAWHQEPMLIPRHGIQLGILAARAWACGGGTLPGLHPGSSCTSIR